MRHPHPARMLLGIRITSSPRLGRTTCAEHGVRPLKTQQKISGRLASDDITQDRLDIRSYIDTAAAHGITALDAISGALIGKPWLPPLQAASLTPIHGIP